MADLDLAPIAPKVGAIGGRPAVWAQAWPAAERFWTVMQTGTRASRAAEKAQSP